MHENREFDLSNSEKVRFEQSDLPERPEVFSRKSYPAVIRFARRFNRLIVPVGSEAIASYEKQYGSPEGLIDQEELESTASVKELSKRIGDQNAKIIRKELGEVLAGSETSEDSRPKRGAESLWKGKDREVILDVVADGIYDALNEDRKALVDTVLGLSAIVERASSETMARSLESLPTEVLDRLGMTPEQREIITALVRTVSKTNPEYLRHRKRTAKGEPYTETATDAFHEWNFIASRLREISEKLNGADPEQKIIFGAAEDKALSAYLTELSHAYAIDGQNERSTEGHEKRMEDASSKFFELYTNHPKLPLIVFPARSHYMADAAPDIKDTGWKKYGFDPELRLYWQSKEQLANQDQYEKYRDSFADIVDEDYSDVANSDIVRRFRVLEAQPLAASGVNIYDLTTAQSEKNIILMVDAEPDEDEKKSLEVFKKYLSDPRDIAITENPAFFDLWKKSIVLHEYGHGLYPEDSLEADVLGATDDQLAEMKSDIAMWVTASRALKDEAETVFGRDGIRAMNLVMIFDSIKNYRTLESKGEDFPYFLSSHRILKKLQAADILKVGDRPRINTGRLDENLGILFDGDFKDVLSAYKGASSSETSPQAIEQAKKKVELKSSEIIKELRG